MATNWKELIGYDLIISTGDGKSFTPDWMSATFSSRSKEFNIAQFVFKNVPGTLVDRGEPMSNVYDLEMYFQGTDTLDKAQEFWESSDDKNPWTINHPFYGSLYVQPINLSQDNAGWNVTKITGQIIDTFLPNGVQVNNQDNSGTIALAETAKKVMVSRFADRTASMSVGALQNQTNGIEGVYPRVIGNIRAAQDEVNTYTNYFNQALSVIDTALYSTSEILTAGQNLICAPANFVLSVKARLSMYASMLDVYGLQITSILAMLTPTAQLKRLYESNAGSTVLGLCESTMLNITDDYDYRPDILDIITSVVNGYNTYVANLNLIQSPNNSTPDSYIPDYDTVSNVKIVVVNVLIQLHSYYNAAKTRRNMTLPEDTNVILLANQLYGMLPDDSTIKTLMANNNIGYSEILVLRKGRNIIYYV